MERFIEVLFFVFVRILTGVIPLDVYLTKDTRMQVPGNTDIDCTLPDASTRHVPTGSLHIVTPVGSEEKVWIGRQGPFTKLMDFRGCIQNTSLLGNKNKPIDFYDPFKDCYIFCDSLSFMLSSENCFCTNTLPPPERRGFQMMNSSIIGNTRQVLCMYSPLVYNKHEFNEQPEGNCVYAFKENDNLKLSNALCLGSKTLLCVVLSRTEFKQEGNTTWLNSFNVCQTGGTVFSSYSMLKENKVNATKKMEYSQQYWIAAFRRPLNTCLAAVLYTNGTVGKPTQTPCNTPLRSLCIHTITSGRSTENVGHGGFTRTFDPDGTMDSVDNGPEVSTRDVDHGGSTGKVESGDSSGSKDQVSGYVWGMVASIAVLCILLAILLFLFLRKGSKSKNDTLGTKTRSSCASEKVVSFAQSRRDVQPPQHVNAASIEDNQESEYHTIGAACLASGSDDGIYHELHEKPRLKKAPECSNYDHVTRAMITDNTQYDVFCKRGKSANSDNVSSDYDTTFSIKQQLEGDYDTAGGQKLDKDLSEYDIIAGPSQSNEQNNM